ncbi:MULTISPECIES: Crp/Fnr family transcriptional regulator [unclassified Devosia]|uniref:Crp/Fnr family transcriptional regulator n=1 Tax=unclassified Devosia TaxID=196773 RepID=UPI001551D8DD|nr:MULTISPECIES: Crp/Fnr family transcriptional regulator [unclassified Devosia]
MSLNILIRKLEGYAALSDEDRSLVREAGSGSRLVSAKRDIIREGDNPSDVHLVAEGLACRYKMDQSGRRQIVAYLLPGDFCDLRVHVLDAMDHSIGALTDCQVVDIPRETIDNLFERPGLKRPLWWATLVDEATLREWLLNMGTREADRRIAHLFCEIHARLKAVGLVADGSFKLPVTQADLADTVGLSAVHVNRTLQFLRASEMITIRGSAIEILNHTALEQFAGFDPAYLHIRRRNSVDI